MAENNVAGSKIGMSSDPKQIVSIPIATHIPKPCPNCQGTGNHLVLYEDSADDCYETCRLCGGGGTVSVNLV